MEEDNTFEDLNMFESPLNKIFNYSCIHIDNMQFNTRQAILQAVHQVEPGSKMKSGLNTVKEPLYLCPTSSGKPLDKHVWLTGKDVQLVSIFVNDMEGVAYASNNEIHVSARYIARYSSNVKTEITGVLYHEATHIWQWNGMEQAPGGLIEGIADYVRLKAGYAPSHWVKQGGGDKWDQGYAVTARFLEYCSSLRAGFVAELNAKMMTGYSNNFFYDLLGKTVDQLWSDYKAMYQNYT